jgi:hypothetical protein
MEEPYSNGRLGLHVCAGIHALSWILRDLGVESFFNFLQHLLILIAANEGDTETLCSETACTPDTMKV